MFSVIGDGIDEIISSDINPNTVFDVLKSLDSDIASLHTNNQILVTSRPTGIGESLGDFVPVRLNGMSSFEQDEFFLKVCEKTKVFPHVASEKDRLVELRKFRQKAMVVSDDLKCQPLFLTLLIAVYAAPQGDLPLRRGSLLKTFMGLLLGEWSTRRLGRKSLIEILACTEDDLLNRLADLAYSIQLKKQSRRQIANALPVRDVEELNSGEVLEALHELPEQANIRDVLNFIVLHAGILHSPAHKKYSFAHRVFQEYLCALYLHRRDPQFALVRAFVGEGIEGWEQVVRLLADITISGSGVTNAWSLVDLLIEVSAPHYRKQKGQAYLGLASQIIIDQENGSGKSPSCTTCGRCFQERGN